MVTSTILRVEMHDRAASLARAGHLAPVIVRPGSPQQLAMPVGPPLGAIAGASYGETVVEDLDRATVVLFTDGLVERRDRPIDAGVDVLIERLAATVDEGLESVVEVAAALADGTEDDVAVLAARF